jgi:hypothetical protein
VVALTAPVDHIDPGSADLHVEIAKLAQVSGNDAMLEESRRFLAKYFPDLP